MKAFRFVFGFAFALCCVSHALAISNGIVISQIYGGGGNAGATWRNDYIELFNRGTTPVDVTGWSVQYASSAGVTWATTALTSTVIQPGQYYLVQEASGGANGTVLPVTADATGSINMSATTGKVALVNSTTALAGACPTADASVVDFIGFGTTTCFEGGSVAPAPSATTSDLRGGGGCTETDNNGADFTAGAGTPRNTGSALNPCQAPTGACCTDFACSIATQAACTSGGGAWQGANSTCTPGLCGTRPCSTIAQAHAQGTGTVRLCNVTVSSTTDLIASATNRSIQLQDATGGITVFGSNAAVDIITSGAVEGDSITVEGSLSSFNGLLEMLPLTLVSNNGHPGVPTPITVTASQFADQSPTAEGLESELVVVHCVVFADAGGTFLSGTNYNASDSTGTVVVRISTPDLNLVNTTIPTGAVNVTGIFSQSDPSDPRDGGYQLLPRSTSDLFADPACAPQGACCLGNGFCSLQTQAACLGAGGSFQGGNTTCTPTLCPGPHGACCNPNTGACTQTTQFACTSTGGNYQGDGSPCGANTCPQPQGACCQANSSCSVMGILDCGNAGGAFVGINTTCSATSCPQNVVPGDLAIGLNDSGRTVYDSALIRSGSKIGQWNAAAFLQSMEFDNAGGQTHNADGNLLSTDFGNAVSGNTGGGILYNVSTNGSDHAQLLYNWNTLLGGAGDTRIGGVGVSPDNAHVSAIGYDDHHLYVLSYNAGGSVGTGSGASITGAVSADTTGLGAVTQGTAWLSNDTVIMFNPGFAGDVTIRTAQLVGNSLAITDRLLLVPRGGASMVLDVEYNPAISSYVYALQSGLESGATRNTLHIIDPNTWSEVRAPVLLDTSMQTGREIALGGDHRLYMSQYAGSQVTGTKIYVDVLDLDTNHNGSIDINDINALTDNSSVDYYSQPPGSLSGSFSGLDVAIGSSDPCAGIVRGDSNGDGVVNNFDIDGFVAALTSGTCNSNPVCRCRNDINRDGSVNNFDIDPFVACLTQGGCH